MTKNDTSGNRIRVLFVCLGNICRSPMAEAIFRHKVKEAGLESCFHIDSAGTGDWHIGKRPHEGTLAILKQYDIDSEGMFARQLVPSDVEEHDYILAMDEQNVQSIFSMCHNVATNNVQLLLDYAPEYAAKNVPDPYFTGNFDEVYELIEASCERLLEQIRRKEGL